MSLRLFVAVAAILGCVAFTAQAQEEGGDSETISFRGVDVHFPPRMIPINGNYRANDILEFTLHNTTQAPVQVVVSFGYQVRFSGFGRYTATLAPGERRSARMPSSQSWSTVANLHDLSVNSVSYRTEKNIDRYDRILDINKHSATRLVSQNASKRAHFQKETEDGIADLPTEEWMLDHRAYRPYSKVVIDAEDVITPELRETLLLYAFAGGNLVISGDKRYTHSMPFGFGFIPAAQAHNGAFSAANAIEIASVYTIPKALPQQRDKLAIVTAMVSIFCLLVFIILLVSMQKRYRYLIFTGLPATAVVCSLLIAVVISISEGVTPYADYISLTVLDREKGIASTIAAQSFFDPTSNRPLTFPTDHSILPMRDVQHQVGLTVTDQQMVAENIVPPRKQVTIPLAQTVKTDAALELIDADDTTVTVVNRLGQPATRILYRHGTAIYSCNSVTPDGGTAVCKKDIDVSNALNPNAAWYTLITTKNPVMYARDVLPDGGYLVWLKRSPFVYEDNLTVDPRKYQRNALVVGVPKTQGGEIWK